MVPDSRLAFSRIRSTLLPRDISLVSLISPGVFAMSQLANRADKSRALYVKKEVSELKLFFAGLTFIQLEQMLDKLDRVIHLQDQEMTQVLKDNLEALTTHASHMRTVAANLLLLKGGVLPALKIDSQNPMLRDLASKSMAFIQAEYQFMNIELL